MGVVQFTVWEAIFLHCYATNRLPYLTDEQVLHKQNKFLLFHFCAGLLEQLEHNNVYFGSLLGSPLPRVSFLLCPQVLQKTKAAETSDHTV